MAAVTELVERLDVVAAVDAAVGPIKTRDRGSCAGQVLVGIAAAQLAGEDFLVGLDRQRADAAGQALAPVPGLASTTAAGLARRMTAGSGRRWRPGSRRPPPDARPAAGGAGGGAGRAEVTIDLDTTDVEVYGRLKRGVAYNYQGQRVGRPHVATWAETGDRAGGGPAGRRRRPPRCTAAGLLRRALAALPPRRGPGGCGCAPTPGTSPASWPGPRTPSVGFAIGAKRIAPLWRMLDGLAETDWTDAIDMPGAQVAVADYRPDWWPADTRLLIRRVRLDVAAGQVSADPRSRRRRTLHPDQRALPLAELADADAVYGYSFILTNLDVSTPDTAAAVEHWYRHRTTSRTSSGTASTAPRCGTYPPATARSTWPGCGARCWPPPSPAGCTSSPPPPDADGTLAGHGVRGGKAMIATLRWRLVRIPGPPDPPRPRTHPATAPGQYLLAEILARLRALHPDLTPAPPPRHTPEPAHPARPSGPAP